MKFLLWLAIVGAVIWLLRNKKPELRTDKPRTNGPDNTGYAEPMSPCLQCGTYIPASEAVHTSSGGIFCCEEHRRKHASSQA